MSSRTKIVVLHMKELLYTLVFAGLGLLFVCVLILLLSKDPADEDAMADTGEATTEESADADSSALYVPGVYTTELVLGSDSVEIEVVTTESEISSITLNGVDDSIRQMYPLLESTFASIRDQIYETGSLENLTYDKNSKYTSLVIIEAIKNSLEKAQP